MDEIRQSILALDKSFKVLTTHYESNTSTLLKNLNEQINEVEKRWTRLIDQLQQCSAQVQFIVFSFDLSTLTSFS